MIAKGWIVGVLGGFKCLGGWRGVGWGFIGLGGWWWCY